MSLIDYGQSKQLPEESRIAFAKLVVALDAQDKPAINRALWDVRPLATTSL